MKKKFTFTLFIIGFILLGSILLLTGDFLYNTNNADDDLAFSSIGCVEIVYSDHNLISLLNPKSMSDKDGMVSTPYTITVINKCSTKQKIKLNLSLTDNSNIDVSKIKVFINGEVKQDPIFLNELKYLEEEQNYRLIETGINPSETKRLNLRVWVDGDTYLSNDIKNIFEATYSINVNEYIMKNTLSDTILNNNKDTIISKGEPNYNQIYNIDSGIYYKDNTYYYRGNIDNNYISFGGKIWRILGINEDNTIKIIYAGNELSSPFSKDASIEENVSLANNTVMQEFLNRWYEDNLKKYDWYIAKHKYCIDSTGIKTYRINYNSLTRTNNGTPITHCLTTDKTYGGEYESKIGLITVDEAMLAGLTNKANNLSCFLTVGKDFYTMSPYFYGPTTWIAIINNQGRITSKMGSEVAAVRPVINLRSDITTTGTGTEIDPYIIDEY